MNAKLSKRIWLNLIIFGFVGQVAWSVENVYFNTFLFNYVGGTTKDISHMVALSAATAVITTFLMGTLSDKLGRRKVFISAGYIVWGFTVAVFALISRENIAELFNITDEARVVTATVGIVIIMDCLMTFMGSTSNDAAFNAWITDVTVPENRGTAEGVLSALPILATVIVTVAFGAGVSAVGYPACFIGLGALVVVCGIIGIFSINESLNREKEEGNYLKDLVYGFRPSVIKKNKQLYLSFAAVGIFSTAVQVFMPYIIIYLQHFLGLDIGALASKITPKLIIIAVLALCGFVGGAIGLGKLVDKVGKTRFVIPSVLVFVAGLVLISRARSLGVFGLLAIIMLVGYGLLMIILNATVRDNTPNGKVGLFQGVRMIFFVLIPMIVGPAVGERVIKASAYKYELGTYINDFGEAVNLPVPDIFVASAIIAVLIFIPLLFSHRRGKC